MSLCRSCEPGFRSIVYIRAAGDVAFLSKYHGYICFVDRPFLIGCILRRIADMLNYFLLRLVGPKMGELKVNIDDGAVFN